MGMGKNRSSKDHTVYWIRGNCIGRGSFGTVSAAINRRTGAVFAVKSSPLYGGPNQAQSLENEIRILSSLSSPYIVNYLDDDFSYESTAAYRNLHMEYLPAGTVAELVSSGADADEKLVRSYTRCIVSALNYLHSKGIAHCDVKGKNVLVGADTGSAKLADFGSAMELGATRADFALPRGSPLWMAPEVIRGEYQGPESDVWSLGCTVIEMVTGKPAWEDRGVDTLSRIGFSQELPEIPTCLSELGTDFVEKCLRRDRSERWSCNQLLQHPFISSASPDMITESSPRCVLDSYTSDFEEQDDDVSSLDYEITYEVSVEDRIRKLTTSTRVEWETEGWVIVRSCIRETEEVEDGERNDKSAKNSACSETTKIKPETGGTCSGYSASERISRKKRRTEWQSENSGGSDICLLVCVDGSTAGPSGCEAGSSCRYGTQGVDLPVKWCLLVMGVYHRLCNLLIMLLNLMRIYGRYCVLYYRLFLASICACHHCRREPNSGLMGQFRCEVINELWALHGVSSCNFKSVRVLLSWTLLSLLDSKEKQQLTNSVNLERWIWLFLKLKNNQECEAGIAILPALFC